MKHITVILDKVNILKCFGNRISLAVTLPPLNKLHAHLRHYVTYYILEMFTIQL